jgi:hypothetical protein
MNLDGFDRLGRRRQRKVNVIKKYKIMEEKNSSFVKKYIEENKEDSPVKIFSFFKAHHPSIIDDGLTVHKIKNWKKKKAIQKRRGRRSYISADTKGKILTTLSLLGEEGAPMTSTTAKSIIKDIINDEQPEILENFSISKSWVNKFLSDANLVPRRPTTSASVPLNYEELILNMNFRIANLVSKYHIPPQLVINFDQMGITFLSSYKQE